MKRSFLEALHYFRNDAANDEKVEFEYRGRNPSKFAIGYLLKNNSAAEFQIKIEEQTNYSKQYLNRHLKNTANSFIYASLPDPKVDEVVWTGDFGSGSVVLTSGSRYFKVGDSAHSCNGEYLTQDYNAIFVGEDYLSCQGTPKKCYLYRIQ